METALKVVGLMGRSSGIIRDSSPVVNNSARALRGRS